MANRYWVGGTGTWDATTTTNWSAASGGAGGASAPTSADNVIFDTASNATAYAVTVGTNAVAADITIAGPAAGNVTITSGATAVINCYGSWLNSATGVVFTTTTGAAINFLATTTGKTVTTNNVTLGAMAVTFNGVGGGWTLGSAFTNITNVITVTAGAFSTGNFAVSSAGMASSGTGVRSVTLGSSTLTLSVQAAWTFTTTTNLTFSAGTSTIICSVINPIFAGGGLTYYNVSFTGTSANTVTISGPNTFNNLSSATSASVGIRPIVLADNQTVNGTLTLSNAASATRRIFISSSVLGTPRTLTVATLAALVDVDFQDIVAAGASAASPWSGTRLGNCLGNTNITFAAGVNKYFRSVSGASANWGGTVWSTSSADTATPAVNDFPLAQDTAIIDDAGAIANNGLRTGNTITISDNWNMGTLNFSGRTTAFTWNQGNQDPTIYGNVTLTSSMTMTGATSPTWTFSGQGLTQTVDSAGITLFLNNFIVDSFNGTVSLARNTTVELVAGTSGNYTLTSGTLDLNGYTATCNGFSSSNTNVRTLAFGSTGKLVITNSTGATCFSGATSTNASVSGTNPLVQFTYSGGTGTRNIVMWALPEAQSISVEFLNNATDVVVIQGTSGGYRNIDFTNFNGTVNPANTPRCFGNFTLGANVISTSGTNTLTFASTSGTKTITSNGKTIVFPIAFNGVGGAWACQDSLNMTGALTFSNGTLQLKSGVTSTVGSFVTSGTTLKYLQSTTPGTRATISQVSGTVSISNTFIKDINVTGGATWNANGSGNTNAGNNSGWTILPAWFISRINSNGVLFVPIGSQFDETTLNQISISPTVTHASNLDEITLQGQNIAKRENSDGTLMVNGYFDEVTGIL